MRNETKFNGQYIRLTKLSELLVEAYRMDSSDRDLYVYCDEDGDLTLMDEEFEFIGYIDIGHEFVDFFEVPE